MKGGVYEAFLVLYKQNAASRDCNVMKKLRENSRPTWIMMIICNFEIFLARGADLK